MFDPASLKELSFGVAALVVLAFLAWLGLTVGLKALDNNTKAQNRTASALEKQTAQTSIILTNLTGRVDRIDDRTIAIDGKLDLLLKGKEVG